jgi:hypothetical protein
MTKKMRVFGFLESEINKPPVEIGIAASIKERNEYTKEYTDVFGWDFCSYTEVITEEQYQKERRKALSSLMSALVVNF